MAVALEKKLAEATSGARSLRAQLVDEQQARAKSMRHLRCLHTPRYLPLLTLATILCDGDKDLTYLVVILRFMWCMIRGVWWML